MKVSIKSSGRTDLAKNEVKVTAEKIDIPNLFSYPAISSIKIKKPNLNQNNRVILKAKQNRQVEVKDCGTLGKIKLPPKGWLKSFNDTELKISVSVFINELVTQKIIASTKRPLVISLADETDSAESPISFTSRDTYPNLWILDEFNEDTKPCIVFSKEIVFKDDFRKDSIFLSSILPTVLREVLTWIWNKDHWEDDGPWIPLWRDFVRSLEVEWKTADSADPDADDVRQTWVESVIDAWLEHNYSSLVDVVIRQFSDIGE